MNDTRGRKSAPKDWWRDFFTPVVGEVMFVPKAEHTEREVDQIIRRSKAKVPLRVLDLACGNGRHSLAFAKRGFEVTGLDYAKPYLAQARKHAETAGVTITFVHGDMRTLRSQFAANRFGLVVSLFNSFGYFDNRRDDVTIIKSVHHVLRPGGAFVVNTLNRGGVVTRLKEPISLGREPLPNVFMIDAARYDAGKQRTFCDWTIVDARRGKARILRQSFGQNVYSHAKLRALLTAAGFRIETCWGTLAGGRFDPARSWHQTIVARKRA